MCGNYALEGTIKLIRWLYKNGKMGADQSPATEIVLNIHSIPHGKQFMIRSAAKAIYIKWHVTDQETTFTTDKCANVTATPRRTTYNSDTSVSYKCILHT